ncbi:MAG TPA: YopT-type cysteine protease domain-containing protein [Telluria sp.]|jgi:YopT-type cysteine protease-like protein
MSYETIHDALGSHGDGKYKISQGNLASLIGDNKAGICRGLSTMWLVAEKTGKYFVKDIAAPDEDTGLLHEQSSATGASQMQTKYIDDGLDTDDNPSVGTTDQLRMAGLGTVGERKHAAPMNFAADSRAISECILTATSRYFILSIRGTSGGHSVAFHRPWALIGKKNNCRFFDPNFGEFHIKDREGIQSCLTELAASYNGGLSGSYRLWGFR